MLSAMKRILLWFACALMALSLGSCGLPGALLRTVTNTAGRLTGG
jgi:hypothetical protein